MLTHDAPPNLRKLRKLRKQRKTAQTVQNAHHEGNVLHKQTSTPKPGKLIITRQGKKSPHLTKSKGGKPGQIHSMPETNPGTVREQCNNMLLMRSCALQVPEKKKKKKKKNPTGQKQPGKPG